MSVLIKGMDIPNGKAVSLIITSTGNVYTEGLKLVGSAIKVPPHGRLLDYDHVIRIVENLRDRNADNDDMAFALHWAGETIKKLPTIIEAEE